MDKNAFQPFRRSQIAELRPCQPDTDGPLIEAGNISISGPDAAAGSPKPGDMIARNPANHQDQWLVAANYFAANFETVASDNGSSEETSGKVASLGGKYLGFDRARFVSIYHGGNEIIDGFCDDVQSLAGTAATQAPDDEYMGTNQ